MRISAEKLSAEAELIDFRPDMLEKVLKWKALNVRRHKGDTQSKCD